MIWWICPKDGQAVIDDASIDGIDCSVISKNIYLVWWYDTWGEILYNHDYRLPIREPFDDFAPCVGIFNQWIRLAQKRRPAISLIQAKFVKIRMVAALNVKRKVMRTAELHRQSVEGLATVDAIADIDILSGWDWKQ